MTAAVPLIHAVTVAMVTGIMVEQTGESEGSEGRQMWEKGLEMERRGPELSRGGGHWRISVRKIALHIKSIVNDALI